MDFVSSLAVAIDTIQNPEFWLAKSCDAKVSTPRLLSEFLARRKLSSTGSERANGLSALGHRNFSTALSWRRVFTRFTTSPGLPSCGLKMRSGSLRSRETTGSDPVSKPPVNKSKPRTMLIVRRNQQTIGESKAV